MKFEEIVKLLELKTKISSTIFEDREVLLVKAENWINIAEALKNDAKLYFDYLMCITSYDLGTSSKFGLAYNFYSTIILLNMNRPDQ